MINLPILMYHKIAEPPPHVKSPALYVRPRDFAVQMEKMLSWGYQTVDFHELSRYFAGKQTLPKKGFVVTFDDGFLDNFTNAMPVIKALSLKATVFLVSDFIGKTSSWPESREKHVEPLLSMKHIEEMQKNGVSFQAHSKTHRHIDRLPKDEVFDEVMACRADLLRNIGEEQVCFCYPYGNYDDSVLDVVKSAGYKMACSIRRGNRYTEKERFFLPRIPVHLDTSTKRLKHRLGSFYHIEHLLKKRK